MAFFGFIAPRRLLQHMDLYSTVSNCRSATSQAFVPEIPLSKESEPLLSANEVRWNVGSAAAGSWSIDFLCHNVHTNCMRVSPIRLTESRIIDVLVILNAFDLSYVMCDL